MHEIHDKAADRLAGRIASRLRLINIAWIVLSLTLLASGIGIIAAGWNFYVICKQWRYPRLIRARSAQAVAIYSGDSGSYLVWGLINLVLGGGIGVALIAAEYFLVRNQVLKNRALFDRHAW